MKTNLFKTSAFVLSLFLFASCMDDKYDLDNVDMTIGTSGDLTLPTCGTDSIVLKNVMDLKDDGVVQVDSKTGEFVLVQNGSAEIEPIEIKPICIDVTSEPVIDEISTQIDIAGMLDDFSSRNSRAIDIPLPDGFSDIEVLLDEIKKIADETIEPYDYPIVDNQASYILKDGVEAEVPKEIVALKSVEFADGTTLVATINVDFDRSKLNDPNSNLINCVHLENLSIRIPNGLNIDDVKLVRYTSGEATKPEIVSIPDENISEGVIKLTGENDNTFIGKDPEGNDREIQILLSIDKAIPVESGQGFVFANNKVSLTGLFSINGTFRIKPSDFEISTKTISLESAMEIYNTKKFDVICPDYVAFNGVAEFENNISVTKFAGAVKTDVNDIEPIELNDMPDFLNDPGVQLDLANPSFFVEVNNVLPGEIVTSISLKSIYDAGDPIERFTDISIPANKHVVLCLASNPEAVKVVPEGYEDLERVDIRIDDLGALFFKLPKQIEIDVADIEMATDGMPIPVGKNDEYPLSVSYKVNTPLEFGEEFKLIYKGLEEGIGEDLNDVDKADTKGVRLEAVVETNLPLNLDLILNPLDKNSNNLKSDADNNNAGIVKVNKIEIEAHRGETKFSEQSITLNIVPEKGHTISEFLKKLDKFEYCAEARADGYKGKLMEDAYIKLKDIKITLVGGVSYDAN